MASVSFRLAGHAADPQLQVVEVLVDGAVVAAIYPDPDRKGIKIVSAHIGGGTQGEHGLPAGVVYDDGSRTQPPIPAVEVRFDPRPWKIEGGKVVKVDRH
jgi:hypothetical protein